MARAIIANRAKYGSYNEQNGLAVFTVPVVHGRNGRKLHCGSILIHNAQFRDGNIYQHNHDLHEQNLKLFTSRSRQRTTGKKEIYQEQGAKPGCALCMRTIPIATVLFCAMGMPYGQSRPAATLNVSRRVPFFEVKHETCLMHFSCLEGTSISRLELSTSTKQRFSSV
ncbi:MAG: hypothetical protein JO266_16480 [Acidobacteria bacterium]|nr:hypothetical protein [Acidobacteriota bacterium]